MNNIIKQVGNYKNAIEYILLNTLDCMNKGMSVDEVIQTVKLPNELKDLPYLQEYYGTREWTIRSIYDGYFGWFDGNPVNLFPIHNQEYNKELLDLIGKDKLLNKVKQCIKDEQYQLALQLLELVNEPELKKECLLQRAKQVTNANARHYYISWAKNM